MATPLKPVLGAQARELRRSRGLTQERLAGQLGVTPRYLAGIERGERNLTLDSVDALADQLGVASLVLLGSGAEPQRDSAPSGRSRASLVPDLVGLR